MNSASSEPPMPVERALASQPPTLPQRYRNPAHKTQVELNRFRTALERNQQRDRDDCMNDLLQMQLAGERVIRRDISPGSSTLYQERELLIRKLEEEAEARRRTQQVAEYVEQVRRVRRDAEHAEQARRAAEVSTKQHAPRQTGLTEKLRVFAGQKCKPVAPERVAPERVAPLRRKRVTMYPEYVSEESSHREQKRTSIDVSLNDEWVKTQAAKYNFLKTENLRRGIDVNPEEEVLGAAWLEYRLRLGNEDDPEVQDQVHDEYNKGWQQTVNDWRLQQRWLMEEEALSKEAIAGPSNARAITPGNIGNNGDAHAARRSVEDLQADDDAWTEYCNKILNGAQAVEEIPSTERDINTQEAQAIAGIPSTWRDVDAQGARAPRGRTAGDRVQTAHASDNAGEGPSVGIRSAGARRAPDEGMLDDNGDAIVPGAAVLRKTER